MDLSSWVGSAGVTLLLIAFVLQLSKKIEANSFLYLGLNIVGAGLAGISSYMISFWPFVILEFVWLLASLIPFIKKVIS